jgi:Raf kinase inhibitor-like YbhB/YbcL family protein
MKLFSNAFENQRMIPSKYSFERENISPGLYWENIPSGTQSFVLILEDPDAPGKTFTHWIIYNIPSTVNCLPENIAKEATLVNNIQQGTNDYGKIGYGGPCPPDGVHRYVFKLYALKSMLNLESGVSAQEIKNTMRSFIIDSAELLGRFGKYSS